MPDARRRPPRALAVKAVLFDLDGTLADSAGDLAGAINRIRRERGLAPVTVASMRPYASAGARGLLGAGMGVAPDDAEYPALREQFLAYYEAGLAETTALFDGIATLLDTLAARRLPFGIVTNKAARYTRPVVAALGLDARAGAVVSGDTTAHPKPHPAPLLHAAELLGVAASDCVYVGDDLRDVIAGNAAGMPTIAAEYGYLGEAGCADDWPATGWIAKPLELLDWLPGAPPASGRGDDT
ncbi:MAG TPA: HAD-IA family hydrolase [Casimicrobiaceae bacterium]|nr:HAD-IA family hydrolase [Casimicrobiaceae bacterium]